MQELEGILNAEELAAMKDPSLRAGLINKEPANAAPEQEQPEAADEQAGEEEAGQEDAADESTETETGGDEVDELENPPKDEQGRVPSGLLKQAKERARAAEQRAVDLENKFNSLVSALESMASGNEGKKEEGEFVPVDEEAFKKTDSKIDQVALDAELKNYQLAMQVQHIAAKQSAPDVDAAMDHYRKIMVENIMEDTGKSEAEATNIANIEMEKTSYNLWKNGKQSYDWFYKKAQRFGFAPETAKKEPKPKGPNLDAINKNRAKSERPDAEKVPVNMGDVGIDSLLDNMKKNSAMGKGVDKEFLNRMLKQARSAQSA